MLVVKVKPTDSFTTGKIESDDKKSFLSQDTKNFRNLNLIGANHQ